MNYLQIPVFIICRLQPEGGGTVAVEPFHHEGDFRGGFREADSTPFQPGEHPGGCVLALCPVSAEFSGEDPEQLAQHVLHEHGTALDARQDFLHDGVVHRLIAGEQTGLLVVEHVKNDLIPDTVAHMGVVHLQDPVDLFQIGADGFDKGSVFLVQALAEEQVFAFEKIIVDFEW